MSWKLMSHLVAKVFRIEVRSFPFLNVTFFQFYILLYLYPLYPLAGGPKEVFHTLAIFTNDQRSNGEIYVSMRQPPTD